MAKKLNILCFALLVTVCSVALGQNLKPSVTYNRLQREDAGLPVMGRIQPVESSLERESLWSVGCETLDRDYAVFDNFKQYVGETGVGYARIQSGWNKTERVVGKYEFEWLDSIVDGLLEEGVRPWVCLCYGNANYIGNVRDLYTFVNDEVAMKAWEKYVKATVKRYKDKVKMWEVWNEPDFSSKKYTAEYAIFFARTAKAVKAADPKAKVSIFALSDLDKPYAGIVLEKLKELNGLKYIDYATYHAYFDNPDLVYDYAVRFRELLKTYNPDAEILQGESGCPGQLEYGHALCMREWTEISQAKWEARHMLTQWGIGVPSSVFTMVDLRYENMIQSFGLIRMNLKSEPQYKRPKFHVVQNVASLVTPDWKSSDKLRVSYSSADREVTIKGIEKDGKIIGCFLWFGSRVPDDGTDREKVDLTIEGAALDNPVYVDMLTGKVHSLGQCLSRGAAFGDKIRISGLPLWDAPVLIVNKNELNIK